jgi:hypothetical protein
VLGGSGLYDAVAVPTVDAAAMARRDRGGFDPDIIAASWSSTGCRALILAVAGVAAGMTDADWLLARADAADAAGDGLSDQLRVVIRKVAALDDPSRAELVFLTSSESLAGGEAVIEPFRRLVLQLVAKVDTRSLDGWILAQLLRARMDRRTASQRTKPLDRLQRPFAEVLTFLAVVGRADVVTAVSVGGYAADLGSVPPGNPNQIDLRTIDRAVDKLRRLDEDGRQRAMAGFLACIGADSRVRPVEARTVQALAAALGAELPVLET